MLHGLGATKVSFLPTVAALAAPTGRSRSTFPASATPTSRSAPATTPPSSPRRSSPCSTHSSSSGRTSSATAWAVGWRSRSVCASPDRAAALVLLAPSLAWLRDRPWAPFLRSVAPQLGLIQPAPASVVEGIVRHVIPGADEEWTAAGIDEFLRSYLTPRGRAAFYAAARNIYLEEPHGPRRLLDTAARASSRRACSCGAAETGLVPIALRRPRPARRSRPPSTSSSTAATSRSSSGRGRPMRRCSGSSKGTSAGGGGGGRGRPRAGVGGLTGRSARFLAREEGGRDAFASPGTWVIRQRRRQALAVSCYPGSSWVMRQDSSSQAVLSRHPGKRRAEAADEPQPGRSRGKSWCVVRQSRARSQGVACCARGVCLARHGWPMAPVVARGASSGAADRGRQRPQRAPPQLPFAEPTARESRQESRDRARKRPPGPTARPPPPAARPAPDPLTPGSRSPRRRRPARTRPGSP